MLGLEQMRGMLGQGKMTYDLKGGLVDHVDGVAFGIRHVDTRWKSFHRGGELSGRRGGIDIVGVEQRRHPRQNIQSGSGRATQNTQSPQCACPASGHSPKMEFHSFFKYCIAARLASAEPSMLSTILIGNAIQ